MFRKLVIAAAAAALLTVSAAFAQEEGQTFVLVHGAFQDASGWDSVIAALEADGHTAVAVQLPAHGDDAAPGEQTLTAYRDAVIEVVEAQAEPVILVGHSFGGITISNVAEAIPARIEAVVYLAAYLPQSGDSLQTLSAQDVYSVGNQPGGLVPSEDFTTVSIPEAAFAGAFCPDCDEEQNAAVAASQLIEPLPPLGEAVTLTAENFGSVRKAYIMTAGDIVVSPQLQALMIANTPVDQVFALNTGHVPYITQSEALAALLVQIADASE